MALKLVIKDVVHYENMTQSATGTTKKDVELKTDKQTSSLILMNTSKSKQTYNLSILNLNYQRKMYQPTEVNVSILFSTIKTNNQNEAWNPIPKANVLNLFKDKNVTLSNESDNFSVGADFYVHEVLPYFKTDSLVVTLKIYSLDKLLTLKHDSRAFVSQKLGAGILATEMPKYLKPYNKKESVSYCYENMKVLSFLKDLSVQKDKTTWADQSKPEYETKKVCTEHIFPYLVQYNESLYDMLVRTCNRWGEFMYYEDGQLNVGYPLSTATDITNATVKLFKGITYINLDNTSLEQGYDYAAGYDKNILDSTLQKSPNSLSGLLFAPGGKMDSVIMKKIAAFFKNDKNLPTFIGNQLFDDLYGLATKKISVDSENDDFDSEHFTDENKKNWPEKYGVHNFGSSEEPDNKEGFNLFTELESTYSSSSYSKILGKEKAAGKDAVCIDFDTNFPGLKLGQAIKVYDTEYIVVQIDCKPNVKYKLDTNNALVENTEKLELVYHVIATVKDKDARTIVKREKDTKGKVTETESSEKIFFPTVIPSGHIRYADPQMATVSEAEDPAGKGRVRVLFSWQNKAVSYYEKKKEEKEKEKDDLTKAKDDANDQSVKDDYDNQIAIVDAEIKALEETIALYQVPTPWIQFTANAGGGKGIMGKHYEDDTVFVGFVDGNVERPYVLGAMSKGTGSDIACETPGGHKMTIADDDGGISAFLLGTLAPGLDTLSAFIPSLGDKLSFGENWDKNLSFAGGFEISDKYGIYKISGSTDGREVAIASPWGEVNVNAFTGINIVAPNGDIAIKGKNVSIEAGNNLSLVSGKNVSYKLWQEKDTKKFTAAQFAIDISLAVAKKVAEKLTNLVDLSIIRSMVEIVMRPVEGALTVKSNRFLKLEAGKSKCAYPVTAYKKSQAKLQEELNEEKKKELLNGTRKVLGVGKAMTEIFGSIGSVIQTVDERYRKHYMKCYNLRKEFEKSIEALDTWKNKQGSGGTGKVIEEDLDGLFGRLKDSLWVAAFTDLHETDIKFTDDVKVEGDANQAVDDSCLLAHAPAKYRHPAPPPPSSGSPSSGPSSSSSSSSNANTLSDAEKEKIKKHIVEERKKLRKKALGLINAIGKETSYLMNFDMKRQYTTKMSSFYFTPAPEDYKDKMASALSKNKCTDVYYYKKPTDNDILILKKKADKLLLDNNQALYTKRLVAVNLIKEFGFECAAIDHANLLDNTAWDNFCDSVTGVPDLGRAEASLSSIAKDALDDALGNLTFWDSTVEKFTWGNGADGKILFCGNDKKTYVLGGKEQSEAVVVEDGIESLKISDLENKEQQQAQSFVARIQKSLKDIKNTNP